MTANIPDIEVVQKAILRAPFHQWLGLKVLAVGADEITLSACWSEHWVVKPEGSFTHGGLLATLVDIAADWSLVATTGRGVPTVDLRIDYLRPAAQGDLTAHGRVIKLGRQFSVAQAEVTDSSGKVLASGRGVYLTAAPEKQA